MTNPFRIAGRLSSAPLLVVAILTARAANAQQMSTGTIIVRVAVDSTPIAGATIATGATNSVTDQTGRAAFRLATGRHTFRVAPAGFRPESLAVFVGVGTTNVTIPVHRVPAAPAPRVATAAPPTPNPAPSASPAPPAPVLPAAPSPAPVAAKRNDQRTSEAATYVQVSDRALVDEQIDRSPGNVAELLSGFDGVRVQPLSAGSGGVGIRIRGMPARYSKILSDGLPLLGATPEGQDPLQMPVLGVDRVEVTPGVMSAFYGPTALSGTVNVVSAAPTSPSVALVNGATQEASDVAVFQTHTFSPQWAGTLLAGRHYRNPGDPDGDGWAEVAGYKRVVVQPRVYWSRSPTSTWFMTGGWLTENARSGTFGDARLPDFNRYSDDADTRRGYAGTVGRIQLDTNTLLTARASITREWRTRWYGADQEQARRNEIFGDVGVTKTLGANVLTGGVAIDRDQYAALDVRDQSYRYTTPALYAEHTWSPDPRFAITSAARLDLQSEFGDFVSPRVSAVVRPNEQWQLRLSRANGFYAPTPLIDETEAFGLSHIERSNARQPEHTLGWSLDVDHTDGALELGGSAYRTVVTHPLVVRNTPGAANGFQLVNGDEPLRAQGIDVHARYRMEPIRFTVSYSYLDATRPEIAALFGTDFEVDTTLIRAVPFNPRHSASLDWAYVRDHDKTLGVAVHFVGKQTLADSTFGTGRPYVTMDARFEKQIRSATVFVYAKDLTGVHQLQLGPVLRPSSGAAGQWADNPWAPLDGRVINAGIRVTY
jgi:iron complex outermembrane receptor protein